jgi:hypothetical protein
MNGSDTQELVESLHTDYIIIPRSTNIEQDIADIVFTGMDDKSANDIASEIMQYLHEITQ